MGRWNYPPHAFAFVVLWSGVNQMLFESHFFDVQTSLSPYINSSVALAVSAYLAAMSFTSSNAGSGPDEYRENETSDDGYIITADDLEMIIRDALSLGRSENGDEE